MSPPRPAANPDGWTGLPRRAALLAAAGAAGLCAYAARPGAAGPPRSVEIADLTWMEVADAVAAGYRTAIVPSGGLEQNGPHLPIGKHDHLVRFAARQVALRLGDALVAPVVPYVPEGEYDPPTGHMRYPGTMGVPAPVFAAMLDGIARSLRAGGFRTICLMADHGGSIQPQAEAAARLSAEWAGKAGATARVIAVDAYYADPAGADWLRAQGEQEETLGQHAGLIDTAELLAVQPGAVHLDRVPADPAALARLGASGDPRRATAERGRALLDMRVDAAVRQIRAVRASAGS